MINLNSKKRCKHSMLKQQCAICCDHRIDVTEIYKVLLTDKVTLRKFMIKRERIRATFYNHCEY